MNSTTDWQTWAAIGVIVVTALAFAIKSARKKAGSGCGSCGCGHLGQELFLHVFDDREAIDLVGPFVDLVQAAIAKGLLDLVAVQHRVVAEQVHGLVADLDRAVAALELRHRCHRLSGRESRLLSHAPSAS